MERLYTMRTQFLMMMIGASLITMVLVGGIFLKSMADANDTKVEEFRAELSSNIETELKHETEIAVSLIEEI